MATFEPRQVQAKFKHAKDFGIIGNYDSINAEKLKSALLSHLNDPDIQTLLGTYRGVRVIHKFNPNTGINVILDQQEKFISGWKLSPDQIKSLLTYKSLGGG